MGSPFLFPPSVLMGYFSWMERMLPVTASTAPDPVGNSQPRMQISSHDYFFKGPHEMVLSNGKNTDIWVSIKSSLKAWTPAAEHGQGGGPGPEQPLGALLRRLGRRFLPRCFQQEVGRGRCLPAPQKSSHPRSKEGLLHSSCLKFLLSKSSRYRGIFQPKSHSQLSSPAGSRMRAGRKTVVPARFLRAFPRAHAVPYDLLTAGSQPGSVICSVN